MTFREGMSPETLLSQLEQARARIASLEAQLAGTNPVIGTLPPPTDRLRSLSNPSSGAMRVAPQYPLPESALGEGNELLEAVFDSMLDGFALHEMIFDEYGRPSDYRYLLVNKAFEHHTGVKADDVLGRRVTEAFPGTERHWIDTYGRVVLSGVPERFQNHAQGFNKYFEVVAFPVGAKHFGVVFQDVTERYVAEQERARLQAQVLHAQKLESLGVLAGGIAHDFNNLLCGMIGCAELALAQMEPGHPALDDLDTVRQAAQRATELCRQMLAYSGKGRFVVEPLDLSSTIQNMRPLLEVGMSKKARLHLELPEGLPTVVADVTQLRQVLLNLVVNASESLGDASGSVTVSLGAQKCDAAYLQNTYIDSSPGAGTYVFLEVSDTGCGMSGETKERLFDPFFSTKFTGRGLGLAAVLGIVRGHRGVIKVYSEIGRGTSIKVLFPASVEAVRSKPKVAQADFRAVGRVLLVDDEVTVRVACRRMLERFGLDVDTAVDGVEALERFRQRPDGYRLVVLDMTMPRMNGEETFRELRHMRPDVRVLLTSGYNEQEATNRFAGKGLAGFLQKPFTLESLRDALQQTLAPAAD